MHDLRRLRPVRRTAAGRSQQLGHLSEVLWTERCRGDDAQRLHILSSVVVEAVYGTAWDAEDLSWTDLVRFAIDREPQHPGEAIDRLFVEFVAVGRRRQPFSSGNRHLESCDAS